MKRFFRSELISVCSSVQSETASDAVTSGGELQKYIQKLLRIKSWKS